MKKCLALIFTMLMLLCIVSCGTEQQVNADNDADLQEVLNTQDELASNKPLSAQFDSGTNQMVLLAEYQLEIPQSWFCQANDEEGVLWFCPDDKSPLSALFLLVSEEKYDITDEVYQKALAETIVGIYCDVFTDVSCNIERCYVPREYITLASGQEVDVTGRRELHAVCSGQMDGKAYEGEIVAFYLGDDLAAFYLFQFCDSAYDFSEDMGAIPKSIKKYDESQAIENKQNGVEDDTHEDEGISTANTSDIAVRFEPDYIDGDRLHITVFTKNNSDEKFSGNVYVTFYSADGKDLLGSDTIIVEELLPGRESWTDIVVDAYRGTPKMAVDFSEVLFVPIKGVNAEIDAEATDKTKNSFRLNFDGVSWYDDVTDIVVYTDGTCIVTIKDNPKEGGQFYASTVESCGEDYGVKEVQVVDQTGKIIAVY